MEDLWTMQKRLQREKEIDGIKWRLKMVALLVVVIGILEIIGGLQ